MSELLSPAGNLEAFYIAIANGADAIYLGLNNYNARAYATNFDIETLKDLVLFAHLRNVKIFVTMNTVLYDDELDSAFETIDKLANIHVDAIIIQDLAVFYYIKSHYKSLLPHASTQMGVDDLYGARQLQKLGFTRIVFARETPLKVLRNIHNSVKIEIETFIHGALCVSYSGNCFMSSMIGERSGNRGKCAGCCRQIYTLIDKKTNSKIKTGFLLSMKDLNTSSNIKDMQFIDSLKIEGRMKEPYYVGGVTSYYRKLLNHEEVDKEDILKVFNRTYTKGFINNELSSDITNIEKPNNYGYPIGSVVKIQNNKIWIKLTDTLRKSDQIRIESKNSFKEISIFVQKLFDANFNLCDYSDKIAIIYTSEKIEVGAKVFKTKDQLYVNKVLNTLRNKEYKKLPLQIKLSGKINEPLLLEISYQNIKAFAKSNSILQEAISSPVSKKDIISQLSKLNDTPYFIESSKIDIPENCFIPLKAINELRRNAIENLNSIRLNRKVTKAKFFDLKPDIIDSVKPELTVKVTTQYQYDIAKKLGIKHIYFKNLVRRNNPTYIDNNSEILIGGFGSIDYYSNKNVSLYSDYSFNITNHISLAYLSTLGIKRITLSPELDLASINKLINLYKEEYGGFPSTELIVYGRSTLMHSKYCPLKRLNMCRMCKNNQYTLKDKFEEFPLTFNDDCTTNILNSKITNLIEYLPKINNIPYLRLDFTTESENETENIISAFKNALEGKSFSITFDSKKHTRGHFDSRSE